MAKMTDTDKVFEAVSKAHWQVRAGVCSCGREFRSAGRRSRQMWLSHRIYEETQLRQEVSSDGEVDN